MLRVRVGYGHAQTPSALLAIVDSGSPYCLFRGDVAAAVGIRDLTKGKPHEIGSVKAGEVDVCYFFPRIQLTIEGNWIITVTAGFSHRLSVPAILGRSGFFDQFFVTFDHSVDPPALDISRIDKVQ